MNAVAHQRVIRDHLAVTEPRAAPASLAGYSVETISKDEARPIIMRYEYLGTFGQTTVFVGLLSPARELHGVACFGPGPGAPIHRIIGAPAMCLERGACVHYAPRNAASFLINAACKLVCRITGVARFFAYSDPMAGEYGAVYQAAGWTYLGQGLNGKGGRKQRIFVLAPGRDPDSPGNWQTTRVLRQGGRNLSFDQARALGWRIAWRDAKHVYATNVGRDRKAWRKNLLCPPYPTPRPELKLRQREAAEAKPSNVVPLEVFRLKPLPPKAQPDLFEEFS